MERLKRELAILWTDLVDLATLINTPSGFAILGALFAGVAVLFMMGGQPPAVGGYISPDIVVPVPPINAESPAAEFFVILAAMAVLWAGILIVREKMKT
jgi:hypothetical protein